MTHPAQQGDVEISRAHNAALRKEISERLGISLDLKSAQMPPHLAMLMRQWRDRPSNGLPKSPTLHPTES
jgi:hypothetical protein